MAPRGGGAEPCPAPGGRNPIKGPDPASSPLPSVPPRPGPAPVPVPLSAPLRSGPAPLRARCRPEGTRGGAGAPHPRPAAPAPRSGGGTRRTWRCRATVTAAASPWCCSWLRASGVRPRRAGTSPAGKVGRAAAPDEGCAPRHSLAPPKFRVPLALGLPRAGHGRQRGRQPPGGQRGSAGVRERGWELRVHGGASAARRSSLRALPPSHGGERMPRQWWGPLNLRGRCMSRCLRHLIPSAGGHTRFADQDQAAATAVEIGILSGFPWTPLPAVRREQS